MSNYTATIRWKAKPGEDYAKGQYSRAHPFSVTPDWIRGLPSFYRRKEKADPGSGAGMTAKAG